MSYTLEAFIGKVPTLQTIKERYRHARLIPLEQGFALVPMTEELFDEINQNSTAPAIDKFTYLNAHVENKLAELTASQPIGYAEADFFGGKGGQLAILWQDKCRKKIYEFSPHAIDALLKDLGVIAQAGNDEFDSLGLGRHRRTEAWVVP